MTIDLILGTAGHIDHGKTSLVRALSGVDTDRLPEERQRGITIELGFAALLVGPYRLGIVDVPGHERFVRNMLAGATGMDLALLVVAADDSVKPQTREHLEILRLLDLEAGIIAVTKCDLVEAEWIELVEEEIQSLVAGTFLAEAPVIRTSTATGEGLDRLCDALAEAAGRAAKSRRMAMIASPFRMAIDRSFTIPGHGTVVTGSVSSGRARIGEELMIEPGDVQVRVRGLQNHDRLVEEVHRGQRAAINLAGVHHDDIRRGQELATPGHLVPSRLLTASLSLLPSAPRPLKHRSRVRVHVGTAELLARVALLDRERLEPGQTAPAQLFLNDAAVTIWSQPLVIRSESPVVTIGGGHVLDPNATRLRKSDAAVLPLIEDLQAADPVRRASAALYFAALRPWRPHDLARTAGIENPAEVYQVLRERGEVREVVASPTRTIRVHRLVFEDLAKRIEAALRKMHEQHPLRATLDRKQLAARFRYLDDALLTTVLEDLKKSGRVRLAGDGVALQGHGPTLSPGERRLRDELVTTFREAGIQSPGMDECRRRAPKNQQAVPQLIALAAAEGELVEIAPGYYLHREVDQRLQSLLRSELAAGVGATLSRIREILETTRKYAVPYCEYLDRIGFTKREGDLRYLASE
jgi:selenocysteine-specific elongation factor